ncbi:LptA/OstA family protein [Bartonella sp. CB175]|uniref:LptA/OstA family protein n=1 Tax=Bartonella sp. CB175 TaxID=3112256 RepID=UPI00300E12EA
MKKKASYIKWVGVYFALIIGILRFGIGCGYAEIAHLGINLSNDKEPVELYADSLEIRDKEGIAFFDGNVSVVQGKRLLRTSKLAVYYDKVNKAVHNQVNTKRALLTGLGSTSVRKMEASGKVYIKIATQIATGDKGVFDGKSNMMVLTGSNVVLIDGDNVATGCKLTANMKTGKAVLEGCDTSEKKSRVSIILKQSQKDNH